MMGWKTMMERNLGTSTRIRGARWRLILVLLGQTTPGD
jgi:hypothetical protein